MNTNPSSSDVLNDSLNSILEIPEERVCENPEANRRPLLNVDTLTKAIEGFAEESAVEIHCQELREQNK